MRKVSNVENVICSAETLFRHPELYHYTKPAAFEGIISSQTLWCSHYREMVDADEVLLMRNLLPPAIAPRMDAHMEKRNRETRRHWKSSGGGIRTAHTLVNALYSATFDGNADYSSLDAYLFSFSTHTEDAAFDREHGIRSQWESYAGPEGYCLVFDTYKVAEALSQEMDKRTWARLTLNPVRYADQPIEDIFPELINTSADTLQEFPNRLGTLKTAVPEFLDGATLLKGEAYKAEREVRIVAIPSTVAITKCAVKEYGSQFDVTKPLPEIKLRPDMGKRYIALFDGMGIRLPVKWVIVGPGIRQEERAARARAMLGDGVPIIVSQCT